ncbi:MAG TPA: hypothetical protein VLC71_00630 [Thermomonas sp.]|nr:hypothetical protein [Thermomonas sp.]
MKKGQGTFRGKWSCSPASLYPSPITVSGLVDNVIAVTVTLQGMSHTFPDDVDVLLVSPTGQQVTLMSDAGGSFDLNGVTLTFRADAATALPDSAAFGPGTYLSTNYGSSDLYPAPAPASTGATDMTVFNGPAANANGTWQLFVADDAGLDVGSISGGWTLTITTQEPEPETTCASEGYTGTKLTWCQNICEKGYTGATLDTWIHRWINRYRDLPYCAAEDEEEPPQDQPPA